MLVSAKNGRTIPAKAALFSQKKAHLNKMRLEVFFKPRGLDLLPCEKWTAGHNGVNLSFHSVDSCLVVEV